MKKETVPLASAPNREALGKFLAEKYWFCDEEDVVIVDDKLYLRGELLPEYLVVQKGRRVRLEVTR